MLGFKSFAAAQDPLVGIELMHMLKKRQTDWLAFGSPVLRSGHPVEQERRIKYRDLVANAVMLHNVVDMTKVLAT
jgi:hypothetical protein